MNIIQGSIFLDVPSIFYGQTERIRLFLENIEQNIARI